MESERWNCWCVVRYHDRPTLCFSVLVSVILIPGISAAGIMGVLLGDTTSEFNVLIYYQTHGGGGDDRKLYNLV